MVKLNFKRSDLAPDRVQMSADEAQIEFMKVLNEYGMITVGLPEFTAKPCRLAMTDDSNRKKSGWYIAFDGEIFGATYGDWRTGEQVTWSSINRHDMTSAQNAEHSRRMEQVKAQREIEQQVIYREAAKEATEIMSNAVIMTEHSYSKKKNIVGDVPVYKGKIVVPAYDENGNISTVQFIADNSKMFLTGGRKKGCFHLIGGETDTIYVCEGWATGKTINDATGKTVAVAFDSGNLMPATENVRAKFPNSLMVIAGDNDHEKDIDKNVGRMKAESCGSALGLIVVIPDCEAGETDFNDIGIERTKVALLETPDAFEEIPEYCNVPQNLLNPDGILADITHYYNATARAPQHGFAVSVSLAIASVLCGRRFKTTKNNFTSMYFLNVATSGTGKEHIKTVCEEILEACGKDELLNGSGYTSAGAVFSTLLRTPRHLTIIDEFGRYLEAAGNKGNSNFQEANTQLMEAVGRCHGTMRPLAYSTMGVSSEKAEEMAKRKIRNPAITLVGMTTPETLFANISNNNVSDGFFGRFIVSISDAPRAVHDDKDWIEVPKRIKEWSEKIDARFGNLSSEASDTSPDFIDLSFDNRSLEMLREFDQERVDIANSLDAFGLSSLAGRSKEMAMRMAMIVTLAKDPDANIIDSDSTSWSIQYVRYSLKSTITVMKRNISNSEHQSEKKEILQALRNLKTDGITFAEMVKTAPFDKYSRKPLTELLLTLKEGDLAAMKEIKSGGRGAKRHVWYAI